MSSKKRIMNGSNDLKTSVNSYQSELTKEMQNRLVKTFLDQIIMSIIVKNSCTKATYTLSLLKKNFGVTLSPGRLYYVLDGLERKGMIKRLTRWRVKTYTSTPKGQKMLDIFNANMIQLKNTLINLTK